MNDDERYGAASDLPSAPPGERERAVREVCERIAAAAAQRAAAAPGAPDQRRRDAPPPTQQGPTLRSPPVSVAGPASAERGPAPAPGQAPPPSLRPVVVPVPAFLQSTAPLSDVSPEALAKGGALPFQPPPAAPAPPPPRRGAPRTVQSRVRGLGETAAYDDDSIQKALAAVSSPVSLPQLTLRQFASLCAELAFQPDLPPPQRRTLLARYKVHSETVFTALDAYWRRERAARPEARTAFADDFATHLAWLHAHQA
jgi:hypothetical protein